MHSIRQDTDLVSLKSPGIGRREVVALGLASLAAPAMVLANNFPSQPIKIVVGVPPGGSIDHGARVLATHMSDILKTPVIVQNMPGAAGMIANDFIVKSPADGYTLVLGTPSPILIAPQAIPSIKFDPLKELVPINRISESPIALAINPKLGAKNLTDLIALSKTRQIKMALPLLGSASHLVTELVGQATGINFLNVPYKGGGPAMVDTIAGHTDVTVSDVGVFVNMHKEGRLRIIAVTSEKRLEALPDVQTVNEVSPGFVATNWLGVFASAKTPAPVVQKLGEAMRQAASRDEVKKAFREKSAEASAMANPEAFKRFAEEEFHRYGKILREKNIVINN